MGDKDFLPIGSMTNQFQGIFGGEEHTISDLKVTESANYCGLFGYIGAGGTVTNLHLTDVNVSGGQYVGGVAGQNSGTIENCTVVGTVSCTGAYAGGIVGYNVAGTISGCTNSGSITGYNETGSSLVDDIAGYIKSTGSKIEDCTNSGNVSGYGYVGSIIGSIHKAGPQIIKSMNSGAVTGSDTFIGGIAGRNDGLLRECGNTGGVSGLNSVGGVAGYNVGTAEHCASDTTATGTRVYATDFYSFAGGVVGVNEYIVRNCYAWGDVTGEMHRNGGAIGENRATVLNVYHAKGTVRGNGGNGGVLGFQINGATATNCVAFSDEVIGKSNNQNQWAVGGQNSAYGTLTNIFYWSGMSVAFQSSNVPQGTGVASRTQAQAWWSGTVGFHFSTGNWRWDSVNGLPVLDGVTP